MNILIVTDFSAHAENAMRHGIALARLVGGKIELFSSVPNPALALGHDAFALPEGYLAETEKRARLKLEELAKPLFDEGLSVSCSLASETPSMAICQRARAVDSDLIVLGTHGRSGLSRAILGSVAERTIRLAHCSTLTAHAESPQPGPIRKILLATDFSEEAGAALHWAASLASRCGAELILLHSATPPFGVGEEETYLDDEATRRRIAQAREQLEDIAGSIDCAKEICVGRRYPDTDILKEAKKRGADLIVLGTRGRRGLPHVLFGSTAEQVVRRSLLPVVSVKNAQ